MVALETQLLSQQRGNSLKMGSRTQALDPRTDGPGQVHRESFYSQGRTNCQGSEAYLLLGPHAMSHSSCNYEVWPACHSPKGWTKLGSEQDFIVVSLQESQGHKVQLCPSKSGHMASSVTSPLQDTPVHDSAFHVEDISQRSHFAVRRNLFIYG